MRALVPFVWLAMWGVAEAGDLSALDAVAGRGEHLWATEVAPTMRRVGGNGTAQAHYADTFEVPTFGRYQLAAVSYEYIDGKLGTVVLLVQHPFDAEGVLADLVAAYGEPSHGDERKKVWNGEKVRLVYRQQALKLWVVTLSYRPLHGDDPEE